MSIFAEICILFPWAGKLLRVMGNPAKDVLAQVMVRNLEYFIRYWVKLDENLGVRVHHHNGMVHR